MVKTAERVYLLYAYRRSLFGSSSNSQPSRFLKDIPPHLVTTKGLWEEEGEKVEEEDKFIPVTALYSKPSPHPFSTLNLKAGDLVHHKMFGDGVVVSCSPNGDDQEVRVDFTEAGTKRLLLSLAPLEKIEKIEDF